ncbi:MAG: hypothetical protein Q9M41_09475 [Paracoccaceae bacterium]|nr:hypothetical protein [Paracoccaceae bacterium]
MKTLMISSAIAVALAASAFSANAQTATTGNNVVLAPTGSVLLQKRKVLGTAGTARARATNMGESEGHEYGEYEHDEGNEHGESGFGGYDD